MKINIYKTVFCLFFHLDMKLCHVREENGLRMFKNRVLRILFGSSGKVLIGDWRKLKMSNFILWTFHQMLR